MIFWRLVSKKSNAPKIGLRGTPNPILNNRILIFFGGCPPHLFFWRPSCGVEIYLDTLDFPVVFLRRLRSSEGNDKPGAASIVESNL